MVVLLEFVDGPNVLLIEIEDGYFADLCDVYEYGVELRGVGVFFFPKVFIIDVNLFFGKIDVALVGDALPFSLSTLMTLSISFLPIFMALWMAFCMVRVYSLMGIIPTLLLYSSSAT